MSIQTPGNAAGGGQSRINPLYFAAWRWHFYAGLYVIPFIIMLSVSGIMMIWYTVFAPEYGDRLTIQPQATEMALVDQAKAALVNYPGATLGKYVAPYSETTPALFLVNLEQGNRMIALDPYTGTILQDRAQDGTWNDWWTALHGELHWGDNGGWGDLLIEIGASLGLLLVVTGLYLAWPRNGATWASAFVPNLRAQGRALWKSLHLVSGVWTSVLLVVFLVSGLAWAGIWGGKFVQAWSTFPAEKWDNVPLSDKTHASMNHGAEEEVPWAIEQTPMPESGSASGTDGIKIGQPVDLTSLVALARELGVQGRFQLAFPADASGVWTISQDSMSYDSPDPTSDITVHVDQYSGKILAQVRYSDYSLAGKSMAVGIAFHEGQMGLWNAVLNIAFCLLLILMSVAGAVMWWKRRPAGAGRLAAPPRPDLVPLTKGMVLIALVMSMAFPVLGLTLLAVLAFDLLVLTWVPPLKRALS